jgi:putative FmdB family regulatory protein
MPIYEYRCENCGTFETTQRITDKPLRRCPTCKKGKVTKLISSTSFQLKGSGWYQTDYASKGSQKAKDEGKTDGKSDSTSASESKDASSTSKEASTPKPSKTEASAA